MTGIRGDPGDELGQQAEAVSDGPVRRHCLEILEDHLEPLGELRKIGVRHLPRSAIHPLIVQRHREERRANRMAVRSCAHGVVASVVPVVVVPLEAVFLRERDRDRRLPRGRPAADPKDAP